MAKISKKTLVAFGAATVAGVLLHFVYAWLPNVLTALFSPVSESLWEHLKILFWPYLVAALILTRGEGKAAVGRWLLSLLTICAAMLLVGYLFHIVLGAESMIFDICLYILLMAVGFFLPNIFDRPSLIRRTDWWILLTIVLGAALVLFTFLTPGGALFADLSSANTWSKLPC